MNSDPLGPQAGRSAAAQGSDTKAQPAPGGKASSAPLMGGEPEPAIFEFSVPGRRCATFRRTELPEWQAAELVAAEELRAEPVPLVEVSERDLVAHVTRLSHRQYCVDLGAYPLGSCTMKYNPKVCDEAAALEGFRSVHPGAPAAYAQGWLELMWALSDALCRVTGMHAATLQPAAGAAGEMTGLLLMRSWHKAHGNVRHKVLIPDSAHGTNPASVSLAGYQAVSLPSDERGLVSPEVVARHLDGDVAGIMLTNPNTLGLFEEHIAEIAGLVHSDGGLLYYDGANLNAIMGVTRPGDMGFDIVHLNLHKTFGVPHGGGGPGAGPVAVTEPLAQYLPGPVPARLTDGSYGWSEPPASIGRVHGWHGNALALVRAWAYILANGAEGLERVSQAAVLNANWLLSQLKGTFSVPFDRPAMHEAVVSTKQAPGLPEGTRALDVAKRLLDDGFHSPTVYFPLVVPEALMIEPTETESPETLAALAEALLFAGREGPAGEDVPGKTPVGRVDEARAARALLPTWDAVIASRGR